MPDSFVLVLVLLAIGLVALLALVVVEARSAGSARPATMDGPAAGLGMSVGMLFGAALGVVVWISTGEFVFWVIFLGAGMTLGLAIGSGYAGRSR